MDLLSVSRTDSLPSHTLLLSVSLTHFVFNFQAFNAAIRSVALTGIPAAPFVLTGSLQTFLPSASPVCRQPPRATTHSPLPTPERCNPVPRRVSTPLQALPLCPADPRSPSSAPNRIAITARLAAFTLSLSSDLPLFWNLTEIMHEQCLKRKNPWLRESLWEREWELNPDYYTPDVMYYITQLSRKQPKFQVKDDNAFLDIHTKKAVLKASSSVVALLSYTGEQDLTQCSGVIIENDGSNGHIVLTSANLIRHPTEEDVMEDNLADSLKVIIYLYDGGSYEGEVCAYDFHYNIAWIRFQSDSSLATARLRQVDDYINVNPAEENSFHLRPHSSHFNLAPGHAIVAVGRYFAKPFDLMAAPGEFSLGRCDYDCKELFMGTCKITRCGQGGALINLSGEVIGITFYENGFTPFMPINIAHKCWEHHKRYGVLRRPSLGVEATNFYAADVYLIEKVIQKFPSICNGVLVEKVIQGSSADSAGLHLNDVIVQCGGKTVRSFLEFLEMVWDKKVGDVLQLSVVRAYQNDPIHVNMMVDEVPVKKFNRWPRN